MEQLVMEQIYEDLGCKTDYDKMMCNELVFLVLSEPSNKTGCDSRDKQEELRKWLYADKFGTSEEKVLRVTGYWGNDLADIFAESVGDSGKMHFLSSLSYLKVKKPSQG